MDAEKLSELAQESVKKAKAAAPAAEAEKDVIAGIMQFKEYGPQKAPSLETALRDSLLRLFDGLHYQRIGTETNDSLKASAKAYNKVVRAHVAAKYGKSWEQCLALRMNMEMHDFLFSTFGYAAVSDRYMVRSGMIFLNESGITIHKAHKLFLKMNASGLKKADQLDTPNKLFIRLAAFKADGESDADAQKRLRIVQKELESLGVAADRILLKPIQRAWEADCSQCPFNIKGYAQRVELTYED
jgi:hypothetical protein